MATTRRPGELLLFEQASAYNATTMRASRRTALKHGIQASAAVIAGTLVANESQAGDRPRRTENVLLVTFDGLRWQELFAGADERMLEKATGRGELEAAFGHESPAVRRRKLLPFFWSVVTEQGQVFGAPESRSIAKVTNGLNFSYPGYSELLTGVADPRIDSNDKRQNPNVNVLEWLQRLERSDRGVAAFCSWDVFPYVLAAERGGLPVNAGWQDLPADEPDHRPLNELARELPRVWAGVRYDVFTQRGACAYLRRHRPRVLYVGYGETDDWAHMGRYDQYLQSAHRTDRYIRQLWEQCQVLPEYAGKTALVLATDHGRGDTLADWTDHGKKTPGSERIWMAVVGPDTPPLGLRADLPVTQSQIAATVAGLLGHDYCSAFPAAAPPLPLDNG
jgi:hypothetical protein